MLLFSELKKRNLLSNESMSNVRGGDSGSCGYETASGKKCGVSKETALGAVSNGGHWCCDSCATSSYCQEQRKIIVVEPPLGGGFVSVAL